MAWEEVSFRGIAGMSGDKPIDEMALALKRIASHYQDAYSRLPSAAEILYALNLVIRSQPGRYVADQLTGDENICDIVNDVRPDQASPIVVRYEGAFVDTPPPGHFIIQTIEEDAKPSVQVIHAKLAVVNRKLICEYRVLEAKYIREPIPSLIKRVLLDDFCDHYYDSLVDDIEYKPY